MPLLSTTLVVIESAMSLADGVVCSLAAWEDGDGDGGDGGDVSLLDVYACSWVMSWPQ